MISFILVLDIIYGQKKKTLSLGKISEWCCNDTKREDYNSDKFNYVNKAVFVADFSLLDRSYKPFVEYIKLV